MPNLLSVSPFKAWLTLALLGFGQTVLGAINVAQTATNITISNNLLSLYFDKSRGYITKLKLGNQDLLGTGQGLYLDCYCIPTGAWTPGGSGATFELFQGEDQLKVPYAGISMSHDYKNSGEVLSSYWLLRDGESGLHTFSRITYDPVTAGSSQNLQEFRVLFRPNNKLWTHLLSSEEQWAPLPGAEAVSKQITVQDATWSLNRTPNDPYVVQQSDYFTKYMFSEEWRNEGVWGMYSDGSTSVDGNTYGAWLVMNTRDSYFNGPIHSDLTVDGIVYNYLVSNHHGDGIPVMTAGFERTFGPQFYYFNKGSPTDDIHTLRADALKFYDPLWNSQFYDSIAPHVPGYVPSSKRGKWHAKISIPKGGATNPIAVLSAPGVDFQDNNVDYTAYQYWGEFDPVTEEVEIDSIVEGTYRLTVYADGYFGWYVKEGIVVKAGHTAHSHVTFKEESAGDEIFRIGIPDKSSGEYLHGYAKDLSKPLQPAQHRQYWAVWDFPTDFPNGVNYDVETSDYSKDMNYVHWSVFGGYANSLRPQPSYTNVNNWTISFDITAVQVKRKKTATFTVQLAGVKTAAGNTDVSGQPWSDLPFTVAVNGLDLDPWIIPYNQSSSCAVRSAVRCYNTAHKFVFGTELLKIGKNVFTLSLPFNATDVETAVLPTTVYLQYDALRLEVD